MHGAAIAECLEQALGFGVAVDLEREREALERRGAEAAAVGGTDDAMSPMRNDACMILFLSAGIMLLSPVSGLSLKRISMTTSAPAAFL